MRLVVVGLAMVLVLGLVPSASARGSDCTIDLHDPTDPVLYGDCIPIVNEKELIPPGILYGRTHDTVHVTVILPDCAAACDQVTLEEVTVEATVDTSHTTPELVIEHTATGHLDPWVADLLKGSYRIA